ncbi:MAG: hypothetical protein LBT37_03340 [Lactobacillaceae bacterium]|jgi:hypothetical protein|nr:hypothetical protein [Lactobacillaceae bacterium]
MATYDFSVRYYGDAVDTGRMPVRELASSLIALSDAFQEVQRIVNPAEPTLSLDIKATSRGSFVADLMLANGPDLLEKAVDLLTHRDSEAMLNLVGYASVFIGAVKFTQMACNKKIRRQEKLANDQLKVTFTDETTIEIPHSSLEAYRSIEFRKSVHEVMRPNNLDGMAGIEFSSVKTEKIDIKREDYAAFYVPEVPEQELKTEISEAYLKIINVAFEHGKWKFSDGINQFFATIEDEEFKAQVEKNECQFGSTDTLKVRLRLMQRLTANGLKSEIFIEKVLEHQIGPRQINLEIEE